MSADDPPPPHVHDLDMQLDITLDKLHRGRWALLIIFALVAVASLGTLGVQVHQERNSILALCPFFADISRVPIEPLIPRSNVPPLLIVVRVTADSRTAYHNRGCQPPLAPPSKSLIYWAAYYKIPVRD
jgi:hypothetical protein